MENVGADYIGARKSLTGKYKSGNGAGYKCRNRQDKAVDSE